MTKRYGDGCQTSESIHWRSGLPRVEIHVGRDEGEVLDPIETAPACKKCIDIVNRLDRRSISSKEVGPVTKALHPLQKLGSVDAQKPGSASQGLIRS